MFAANFPKRHAFHLFAQGIAPCARIHHPQLVQLQVLQGDVHAAGGVRCVHALELHADALALVQKEQVEFGAAMDAVEVGIYTGEGIILYALEN